MSEKQSLLSFFKLVDRDVFDFIKEFLKDSISKTIEEDINGFKNMFFLNKIPNNLLLFFAYTGLLINIELMNEEYERIKNDKKHKIK